MSYQDYRCFKFREDRGVLFVTIDSPPINLMTLEMASEITRLTGEIAADDGVKVVVFRSANPAYFIAHFDVTVLAQFPDTPPPKQQETAEAAATRVLFRSMPKISIAQIEGRARGGGSEFALSLDMRFGALGKTVLGQPEIAVGILPGGGGTQRLPRLIGRARALEVVMSGMDLSAETAERYGYINRALPPDELGPFVETLAYRIASYSSDAIALLGNSSKSLPTTSGAKRCCEAPHSLHPARPCTSSMQMSGVRSAASRAAVERILPAGTIASR